LSEELERRTWFAATFVLDGGERVFLRADGSYGLFGPSCLFEQQPEGARAEDRIVEVDVIVRRSGPAERNEPDAGLVA
jgi:hypothetical protein